MSLITGDQAGDRFTVAGFSAMMIMMMMGVYDGRGTDCRFCVNHLRMRLKEKREKIGSVEASPMCGEGDSSKYSMLIYMNTRRGRLDDESQSTSKDA